MRAFILCALVATAVFASPKLSSSSSPSSWNVEQLLRRENVEEVEAFRPGNEYRFHYDMQIASGIDASSTQHTLSRWQALVSLVFQDEQTALLQIQKVRSGIIQKELEEPKMLLPFEVTDEIQINEDHVRVLRLPLRFRYDRGLISEIEFDREDNTWSMNIKRAILNMLQVNMDKKNVVESAFERETLKDGEPTAFRANEHTIEGDCEVIYTVQPIDEQNNNKRNNNKDSEEQKITKSINYEKCANRVGLRLGFRFGDECPTCENKYSGEERNIESSTVLNYRLSSPSSSSAFALKESTLSSAYIYAPLNEKETLFKSYITGKLTMFEHEKKSSSIEQPKADKKETILYSLEFARKVERFLTEGGDKSPFTAEEGMTEMKNKPELVSRLVKSIVAKMEKEERGVEIASTHEMARLVEILRFATRDELRKIHKEVCESSEHEERVQQLIRDIINDALAVAGSANTVEHLVEKLREKQVSPMKAALIFKHLTNIRTPSEKMIDQLISLCKEQKRQPIERQSCWLTTGALINGLCGEHRDRLVQDSTSSSSSSSSSSSDKKMCPRNLKEKYVRELVSAFETSESRYEKILALKTIANAGVDLAVFPLEKIIRDQSPSSSSTPEETTVRVQAIEALRKLRSTMPRKVLSILMPVYKNIYEKPEIRVAAFHQIMQTVPERAVIDQITEQLIREPSHQVHSFVLSTLEQYAKSTIACEKRMADDITHSLRLARVTPRKAFDSVYGHHVAYSDELKAGGSLNWALLFTNDSVLPKEAMASLETAFGGQWHKCLAQIGFTQQNLDSAISKILKKIEEKGLEEIVVRGKRSTSTFRPTEMLRDLFTKLAIKTRKQMETDPHALIYVRFRDMDYAMLPIDDEVIPDYVKQIVARGGRFELAEIEQALARGFRFNFAAASFIYERTRHIASSAGLPLVYTSKMPTVFKMSGSINAEITPKSGETFEGLRFRIQAKPSMASTHVTSLETFNPIATFGVKLLHSVQANIPVETETEMKWTNRWTLKTTMTLPKESKMRLFEIQTRPTTYVKVWPKETRAYVESKEKTIYVDKLETSVKKIDDSYLEKAIGAKINVIGHIHGHIFESGVEGQLPSALLIGENNLIVEYERTSETPKEYVAEIQLEHFKEDSKDNSNKRQPEFDNFFEKDNEEHFDTEDVDFYPESEQERRSAFKTYVKNYKSGKTYEHRLVAKIRSIGGRVERFGNFEIIGMFDEKMRSYKLEMNVERTPVTEEERQNWKMTSSIKVLYPEMPESLEELLNQKHRELSAEFETRFGEENKESSLKLKIQGEQNKDQKQWIKHAIALKEQQKENGNKRMMTSLEEYSRLLEASMLNQYKIVARFDLKKNAKDQTTMIMLEKAYAMLKYYAPFLDTEVEYVKGEPRLVKAVITLEPETRQYANVTIESPRERLVIRDIRLPLPLRLINIRRQSMASPVRSLYQLSRSIVDDVIVKAECLVESRKVNSFDDVIFRAPITTCYSVLAKDCSDEQDPEFAVLMRKISSRSEEKKMKIVNKENVIELEKRPEWENIKVFVNGEEIESEEKLEKFRVFVNGRDLVTVELDDVKVDFDGYTARVKMSELYKNKQCGLCGHFDGEKRGSEFRRADDVETEDMEEFHRSFFVKSDKECEIDENEVKEKKNYGYESESSSSEEESIYKKSSWEKKEYSDKKVYRSPKYEDEQEIVDPIERTRVIEFSSRVCFSKEPVPECPRKTVEKENNNKEMKVRFSCVPRSSSEAQRLLRESRRSDVITDLLEKRPENFVETLEVPRSCVVY